MSYRIVARMIGLAALAGTLVLLVGCSPTKGGGGPGEQGKVKDEAMLAGRLAKSFGFADEDFFEDMDQTKDGHLKLNQNQVRGRNMWIVWTGGNDRLWDVLNWKSFGTFDLLKTVSSHKNLKFGRYNRWKYLGVVNEPCFEEAKGPDPERFGLWLDKRIPGCDPRFDGKDPFANEANYPGVKFLHRGEEMPVGSFYGYPTGIVGLRLFPNPYFDAKAKAKWDAVRYYDNDPSFVTKDLVRPYRVGMACAFCHIGPNPLRPPADPNNPKWENLSSNVGAQYFWFDRIFAWQADEANFIYQTLHTYKPGSLDTSLVSTDYIDNPRTMNAVYYLGPRLELGKRWGNETLAGGGLNNKQLNDFFKEGPLTLFFEPPAQVWNPRVLKDGADSVGVLGALNRVYLNIGLYSEDWLRHFNALFGGQKTTPIEIAVARENSTYWNVTESWTPAMADFFLHSTEPHHLADAPGGKTYLTDDAGLTRGKEVFAERCARCHSSKGPMPAPGVDPGGCSGKDYYTPDGDKGCWNRYWAWTKTSDFKAKMREIVMKPDFLVGNYLSSELRVPVTLLQTNACSPFASNAIGGSIWDNFSSQTYKDLPSAGEITWYHPVTGEAKTFKAPAGGRGYTRPASLVSLWSTSPFLLNNSVGDFHVSPSVEERMKSFDTAIEQMLWPEKREQDKIIGGKVKGPSRIERTTKPSFITIPFGFLPGALADFLKFERLFLPWLENKDGIKIGPIPEGTPVGLLANLDFDPGEHLTLAERLKRDKLVLQLAARGKADLKRGDGNFSNLTDLLLELSKCPDYIVNRGHYFGTDMLDPKEKEPGLSDSDKKALIAFLKTF